MHLTDFHYVAFCSLTFMQLTVTSFVSVFALDLPAEIFAFLLFLTAASVALTIPFDFSGI